MPSASELPPLIDRICATHHAFLRDVLPRIDGNVRALRDHPDEHQQAAWRAIFKTFFNLRMEIEAHLHKEEDILFPTIRSLVAGTSGGPADCGVEAPVRQMNREHADARKALDALAALRAELPPPNPDAPLGAKAADALRDLAALDADLREHIRVEEDDLFPSALALEQ